MLLMLLMLLAKCYMFSCRSSRVFMYKARLATFTNMWLFARMRRRSAQPRAQVVTFLFSKKQRIVMVLRVKLVLAVCVVI